MTSDQLFVLSVGVLGLILLAACFRVRTDDSGRLALNALKLSFLGLGSTWILFVWPESPVLLALSYFCCAIYMWSLPVFALGRAQRRIVWPAIIGGAGLQFAGYMFFQLAGQYDNMLQVTTLFCFPCFLIPAWAFLRAKPVRTSSDTFLAIAYLAIFGLVVLRSAALILLPEIFANRFVASAMIWPGLYAACGLFAITGYMEEAQEKLKAQAELLREQAWRDPLTRLLNRRGFDEAAHGPLANADRTRCPMSLIVVDVDHFKAVNDTYGHDAGDAILQALATTLKVTLRDSDVLARFGGEEFVILLPGMDLDQACACAERLRAEVALIDVAWKDTTLRLTASFGVAAQTGGADLGGLFRDTDAALYRAKANGRNRVETATLNAADLANAG